MAISQITPLQGHTLTSGALRRAWIFCEEENFLRRRIDPRQETFFVDATQNLLNAEGE